jgi:hypothetical protein
LSTLHATMLSMPMANLVKLMYALGKGLFRIRSCNKRI